MNTNLHPRLWSANAIGIYNWWVQRSNCVVRATSTTNQNRSVTSLSISGAASTNTAVDVLVTGSGAFYELQVTTNGVTAGTNVYRTVGPVIRVRVGTAVTNVNVSYVPTPTAQNDFYLLSAESQLNQPAPGVMLNDAPGFLSSTLNASLLTNVQSGTLQLSNNGSFSYQPSNTFSGVDFFYYRVFQPNHKFPASHRLVVRAPCRVALG